jgi:hypothetical protein
MDPEKYGSVNCWQLVVKRIHREIGSSDPVHPNMRHSHAWFRDMPQVKSKLESELKEKSAGSKIHIVHLWIRYSKGRSFKTADF